jgi:Carbohydrate esterase, sialic acid-specific acetylesterase
MLSCLRSLVCVAAAFVLTGWVSFACAGEKPVYLFILSGQSNMGGLNPEKDFMPEATKLFADGEVVYVKVASGGKPIRYWVSSWNEIGAKHGIDLEKYGKPDKDKLGMYYKQILSEVEAKLKGRKPKAVTFCWMQGENEARFKLEAAYTDALNTLLASLRADLKCPEMNAVIARISDNGKEDDASWQKMREILVAVAKADPRGAWVDCDDLNDKNIKGKAVNDLHYTPEGYKTLGERYARQAKALIDGKKPAENGRP